MPIFEYKCEDCSTKHEVLHKSSINIEEVTCPNCNSNNNKKLLSSFSASMGNSGFSAGDSCATGACGLPAANGCSSGTCGLN